MMKKVYTPVPCTYIINTWSDVSRLIPFIISLPYYKLTSVFMPTVSNEICWIGIFAPIIKSYNKVYIFTC